MKIVSYMGANGQVRGGVVEGDLVCPLPQTGGDDVLACIRSGTLPYSKAAEAQPLTDVKLLAPLQHPPRIFGIGLNYKEHAIESKMAVQSVPTVFLKLASSITGPNSDVLLPPDAAEPDFEAELAVVIGKQGHRIVPERWHEYVFGYTIINDVSARGVQLATTQWTLGKSFPTFTPMGPWIITKDEIPDPHALDIRLTLSGEVMQSANTRDLIFQIPALIRYISNIVALEPGDIISTGTPPGVGLGRKPQRWLRPEEDMEIEIEGIGKLCNHTRSIAY